MSVKRGEVWWVALDPAQGSEIKKLRPAVVVSNDVANRHLTRVQVVPVTSNTDRVYQSECLVTLKNQTGKAMADQIRTVSKDRLQKKITKLSPAELAAVEHSIRVQLEL